MGDGSINATMFSRGCGGCAGCFGNNAKVQSQGKANEDQLVLDISSIYNNLQNQEVEIDKCSLEETRLGGEAENENKLRAAIAESILSELNSFKKLHPRAKKIAAELLAIKIKDKYKSGSAIYDLFSRSQKISYWFYCATNDVSWGPTLGIIPPIKLRIKRAEVNDLIAQANAIFMKEEAKAAGGKYCENETSNECQELGSYFRESKTALTNLRSEFASIEIDNQFKLVCSTDESIRRKALLRLGFIARLDLVSGELKEQMIEPLLDLLGNKGCSIGASIPRNEILKIYSEGDLSWKKYFTNPEENNLIFKPNVEKDIKYGPGVSRDKNEYQLLIALQRVENQEINWVLRGLMGSKISQAGKQQILEGLFGRLQSKDRDIRKAAALALADLAFSGIAPDLKESLIGPLVDALNHERDRLIAEDIIAVALLNLARSDISRESKTKMLTLIARSLRSENRNAWENAAYTMLIIFESDVSKELKNEIFSHIMDGYNSHWVIFNLTGCLPGLGERKISNEELEELLVDPFINALGEARKIKRFNQPAAMGLLCIADLSNTPPKLREKIAQALIDELRFRAQSGEKKGWLSPRWRLTGYLQCIGKQDISLKLKKEISDAIKKYGDKQKVFNPFPPL